MLTGCVVPLKVCRPTSGSLYIYNPNTSKFEGDLDILKMYLYIENEVARLMHSKLPTVDDRDMYGNKKNRKIALKLKSQGQMSPTSIHF